MLVIKKEDGSYHVHAPFHDEKAMEVMLRQIRNAQDEYNEKQKTGAITLDKLQEE
jgi:hypothetical protein